MGDLHNYITHAALELKISFFCAVIMGLSYVYMGIDPILGVSL